MDPIRARNADRLALLFLLREPLCLSLFSSASRFASAFFLSGLPVSAAFFALAATGFGVAARSIFGRDGGGALASSASASSFSIPDRRSFEARPAPAEKPGAGKSAKVDAGGVLATAAAAGSRGSDASGAAESDATGAGLGAVLSATEGAIDMLSTATGAGVGKVFATTGAAGAGAGVGVARPIRPATGGVTLVRAMLLPNTVVIGDDGTIIGLATTGGAVLGGAAFPLVRLALRGCGAGRAATRGGSTAASFISDAVGKTPRCTAAAFCSTVRRGRIRKKGSILAAAPGIAASIARRAPG